MVMLIGLYTCNLLLFSIHILECDTVSPHSQDGCHAGHRCMCVTYVHVKVCVHVCVCVYVCVWDMCMSRHVTWAHTISINLPSPSQVLCFLVDLLHLNNWSKCNSGTCVSTSIGHLIWQATLYSIHSTMNSGKI